MVQANDGEEGSDENEEQEDGPPIDPYLRQSRA